jgi:membrane protein DedA with SNARE-associated domain
MRHVSEKTRFLLTNLAKGTLYLFLILAAYLLIRNSITVKYHSLLATLLGDAWVVIGLYLLSEVIFGIIPPEVFMLWALRTGKPDEYAGYVALLAAVSFLAGWLGYYFGRKFGGTLLYRRIRKRYLSKWEPYLQQYGGFLVVVGAVTPVPYSGTCMIAGAVNFPHRQFLLYSSTRFIRFAIYAWIVWGANMI